MAPCGLSNRLPPQFDFVFGKWAEEVKADPSLAAQQPYKAIIEKDPAFFVGLATQDPEIVGTLLKAFARSWAGTTPEEFDAQVRVWLGTVKQPKLGKLYVDLVYKPMLELFDLFEGHDFRIFVVSGGGRDFMRVFAEGAFGIYKENVIGTAAEYNFTRRQDRAWPSTPSADLTLGRASPSTSSPRPDDCPCLVAGTPTWTSRCCLRPTSPC